MQLLLLFCQLHLPKVRFADQCFKAINLLDRCCVNYCGLKCYQSEAHRECSEGFYKECVERELHGQGLGEESKKKMQDILQRVHRKEEDEEGEDMDSDDDEDAEELEKRLKGYKY